MSAVAKRPKRKTDCVVREIAGETIIVPIRGNVGDLDSVYTLSEIASTIWRALDGRRTVDQIAGIICDEYEVSRQEAAADIALFVADLEAAGLAEMATDADGTPVRI